MKMCAKNCQIWKMAMPFVLALTLAGPAQGFDDEDVQIEVDAPLDDEDGYRVPPRKRFANPSQADDSGLNNGDPARSRISGGERQNPPPSGPGNERFGKTKGKVRFVLVEDQAATDQSPPIASKKPIREILQKTLPSQTDTQTRMGYGKTQPSTATE